MLPLSPGPKAFILLDLLGDTFTWYGDLKKNLSFD